MEKKLIKRILHLLVLAVAILALLAGCAAEKEDTGTTENQPSEEQATEQATETAATDFETAKGEFVGAAKGTLADWNTKIADVETQIAALPEIAQKPLQEPVQVLKDKTGALGDQIGALEGAAEDTFEDEKAKVEQSMGEVKEAYDNVMSLF